MPKDFSITTWTAMISYCEVDSVKKLETKRYATVLMENVISISIFASKSIFSNEVKSYKN